MRNPFRRDLVLLHAPALYDFRTRPTFLGPLADAVPSTTMFEMYPVGLTSIAAFLDRNHYNVEIVNLAYRMLRDRRYDVAAHLARLDAPVFGIDLHWLPHAQGALSIAELVKRIHPGSRVLLGGLSATYYHEELVRHAAVDFVLRGDSTEEPGRQLLQALRDHRPLEEVENLTWTRSDGAVVAPLGPFLDPGSRAFEDPELGYRTLCRTLDEHRQAFLNSGWHRILSYETDAMTRDEIVRATYDVAERLNAMKRRFGLIDERTFAGVADRLAVARRLLDDPQSAVPPAAIELANHGTMFGDDELQWPMPHRFRVGAAVLRTLAAGLVEEVVHTAARLVGRYDVAPARPSASSRRGARTAA